MKTAKTADLAAPSGLIESAKKRTQAVVTKLRAAMKTVEAEIDAHEGIYPLNGGKLSQAELCRRAGISNVTLSTPAHRDTTRKMVEAWLARVKSATATGRKSVRRAVTDRADSWKRAHAAIAQSYRTAELDYVDMRAQLQELRREVQKLEGENAALRTLLDTSGSTKVVPFPGKEK